MPLIIYEGSIHFSWYKFCVDKTSEFPSSSVEYLWWWSLRFLLDEPDWWGYWQYKVAWHRSRYNLNTPKIKRVRVLPKVKKKPKKLRGRKRK